MQAASEMPLPSLGLRHRCSTARSAWPTPALNCRNLQNPRFKSTVFQIARKLHDLLRALHRASSSRSAQVYLRRRLWRRVLADRTKAEARKKWPRQSAARAMKR
eukprot:2784525-Pleurochrysis_carterae.AAC.2